MKGWIEGEYTAIVFERGSEPVAYARYRETPDSVYVRHLFVSRSHRREGIGRKAVEVLRSNVFPARKRLTVDVLSANTQAVSFWRSVGFADYCLTLEIMPEDTGASPLA